jgi:hypothetical protein
VNQVFSVDFHFFRFLKPENSDPTTKPVKQKKTGLWVAMSGAISIFVYLSNTITNLLPKIVPKKRQGKKAPNFSNFDSLNFALWRKR